MISSCLRMTLSILYSIELFKIRKLQRKGFLAQQKMKILEDMQRDKQSPSNMLLPLGHSKSLQDCKNPMQFFYELGHYLSWLNAFYKKFIPSLFGGVGIFCSAFILLIKLFPVWSLIQVSILVLILLIPYFILAKSGSGSPSYNGLSCFNLSHKLVCALFLVIASNHFDDTSLFSLYDLISYMVAAAAYSCYEIFYFCFKMCLKSECLS